MLSVIADLFIAGSETTSNAIGKSFSYILYWLVSIWFNDITGFSLLYLIHYPEVQRKMQSELDDICGNSVPLLEHRPKWELLRHRIWKCVFWFARYTQRLPYTEAVLLETQRIASIGPLTVPHRALKDTRLCGYFIPKVRMLQLTFHFTNLVNIDYIYAL